MNTSSIVDILRLLVTIDSSPGFSSSCSSSATNNGSNSRAILWLKKIRLIDHLVGLFANDKKLDNRVVASVYCNVSQAICDLVKITRDQIMNLMCENNMAAGLLGVASIDDGATFRMDHDGASSGSGSDSNSNSNKAEVKPLDVPTLVKNSILEDIER